MQIIPVSRDYNSDAAGFNVFEHDVDTLLFGDRNLDIETNKSNTT